MTETLILASGSAIRATLLAQAEVPFTVQVAQIDEEMVRTSLQAQHLSARDIADALAELKAQRVSNKNPAELVLGCDQILDFAGLILAKPENQSDLKLQLQQLRGGEHSLHTAAVIFQYGRPIWRSVQTVTLHMRDFSDVYLMQYIEKNWDIVRHCVGGYALEGSGTRLFSKIDGDYFSVLGLPLLDVLTFLTARGLLQK